MLSRLPFCFVLMFTCLPVSADDDYRPKVAEASKDGQLAIQGFVMPEGMSAKLLASEPALANPVAFYPASDGRVYVCETFRQEVGVEDNRSHMDWLNNDLRLESVEERLAMFKKYLGTDVSKYATQHDRVRVLQDTNNDGVFDSDKVFAQGFNDILDGTGAGVVEHDGKVYYTCIPKLWMLEDADRDGVAENTEPLHHGYGVRVAFRGHDMHGLVVGPDGRLYFSIGDRGYNVITKEGTRLKRVDSGAVFRCDMDGSNLEVFAFGLRNPQELAFDDDGNLWTGDNNSDSGDQARWVYVVQDGDTGWRMYFQYLDDRGPWNRERMWYPYRADEETAAVQPAYIVPPVANLGDGPSGLTYYPGIGLSDRYRNHFFMADFRGGASNSGIRSFSVEPKGASFELTDSHQFIWSILGTDVDFAADGSLYVTDWVNGWVGEGKGRLYRFVDDEHISEVEGANVSSLLNGGIRKLKAAEQLALLNHADRRVRQAAQFEIVKQDDGQNTLLAAQDFSSSNLEQRHVAWGLWQVGLKSAAQAKSLEGMWSTAVAAKGETGIQYIRVLTDLIKRYGIEAVISNVTRDQLRTELAKITTSSDLRLAGFASVALGAVGKSGNADALLTLLERNNNEDPVLRHQAVMGLKDIIERDRGISDSAMKTVNSPAKLGLVLVMARLQDPNIVRFLSDDDMEVVDEAARAIHEHNIAAGYSALAALAGSEESSSIYSDGTLRRGLEMLYRIGTSESAKAVAAVASDSDRAEAIRMVAAEMLLSWNNPQQTDTVNGRWRELSKREVQGLDAAIGDYLPGMLAGPAPVRRKSIQVAALLGIQDVVPSLSKILANTTATEESRVAAFKALAQLSKDVTQLLADGKADVSEGIRIAALELLAEKTPEQAIGTLAETVDSGSTRARQTAIELLGTIAQPAARRALSEAFVSFNKGELPNSVALDLVNAAQAAGTDQLKTLVAEYRAGQSADGTKVSAWSDCLEGGDVERGKTVFFGRAAASCRRCHKVNGSGADVGPDLSVVAKDKDRQYLLESIVDPNAKIAKGFETTIIVDIQGKIHAGIIKEDNDQVVKLMSPKGAIITVAQEDIDERAKGLSGMPADLAKNLSRSEVRDLVAYLSTLKVAETTAHGNSEE